MSKIAIVGGSGFIGSNLANKLDNPYILDTVRPLQSSNYIFPTDVTTDSIKGALSIIKPKIVYYMAAIMRSEDCRTDPANSTLVNIQGLSNTLAACRDLNIDRFIYSSSVHVYAGVRDKVASESTVLDSNVPAHIYPTSKLAGEMIVKSFNMLYDIPYTILRYGIVYGPGGHSDMVVHSFVKNYINQKPLHLDGGGTARRNFIHIDDLVAGNVAALKSAALNETFNICSSDSTTVKEVGRIVQNLGDHAGEYTSTPKRLGDFNGLDVCNKKAEKLLGWSPKISLETGIKQYYEWYKTTSNNNH
jgi:UDP-glucose 4-epimerase